MRDILSASLEDYLETILLILREKQAVRAKEIARRMEVSGPSVTGALHALADRGLIRYAPYDVITLTEEGERIARDVRMRHEALRDFFVHALQVDPEEAERAACAMEHSLPSPILGRLVAYLEFMEACPRARFTWDERRGFVCRRECADTPSPDCRRRPAAEDGAAKEGDGVNPKN